MAFVLRVPGWAQVLLWCCTSPGTEHHAAAQEHPQLCTATSGISWLPAARAAPCTTHLLAQTAPSWQQSPNNCRKTAVTGEQTEGWSWPEFTSQVWSHESALAAIHIPSVLLPQFTLEITSLSLASRQQTHVGFSFFSFHFCLLPSTTAQLGRMSSAGLRCYQGRVGDVAHPHAD